LISLAAYITPTIVALVRKPPQFGAAIAVDIFLGWTIVGWVVALAMACRSRPQPQYLVPPGWAPQQRPPGWPSGPAEPPVGA
jgi:hypothetical protein